MGGMSYADQVRMFFDSDIVLGGHGTAMTNCMFLLPHSVLIELYPEESRFSVRFHDNRNRNEYECFRSCVMND